MLEGEGGRMVGFQGWMVRECGQRVGEARSKGASLGSSAGTGREEQMLPDGSAVTGLLPFCLAG